MNTIRMIAVALPMTILIACGGGGGGGGTAAAPTTPPTTTPTVMLETLPGYAVVPATARTRVGGAAPTAANTMSETAIVTEIQRIATAADTFEFSDFGPTASAVTVSCTNKSCTTGHISDVGLLTFSLNGIDDLSLVDDSRLVGFASDTEAVMVDGNVTLIQSQAAGRQSDGTQLTFQTYGGWVTNSVFGVELLDVTENGTTTSRFASFSFGNDTGELPAGNASPARWTGSMVGMNTSKEIIQGRALIEIDQARDTNIITYLGFDNIVNINDGSTVADMDWFRVSIENDGTFSSTTGGNIEGAFYGTGGTEAGGTFNRGGFIGAFGVKK
ncbi:MAG: hypothetical protein OXE98_05000 [Hyphomicrobiales bacterium]|nr:hypothetical protein [Hyphomicrobiales bacterium]